MSSTLAAVDTPSTTLLRSLDVAALARLKDELSAELAIGGSTARRRVVSPVIVGDGLRALPEGARFDLELVDERAFGNGIMYAR